ncbi:MAG: TIGR03067 domain-containing protein [Gemmataceae bacterium]|nr:TIGR03067 domain-containing protein [Gemmataceae bacterium]
MPRFALFGVAVLVLCGFAAAQEKKDEKKEVAKELAPFQGTWKVVKATLDGKEIPEKEFAEGRFVFAGDKVTAIEKKDGKADEGTFVVDPKKDPAEIDLIQTNDKVLGIYKFDKDGKLIVAFGFGKDARPKSFDDKKSVVLVLEKVKK